MPRRYTVPMSIRQVVLVLALAVAAAAAGFLISRTLRGAAAPDGTAAAAAPSADDELQIGDLRPDMDFTALDGSTALRCAARCCRRA